ncbi:MAG: hypothetical protein WCB68_17130, partial [Pyrinomonadaceae bacterium]
HDGVARFGLIFSNKGPEADPDYEVRFESTIALDESEAIIQGPYNIKFYENGTLVYTEPDARPLASGQVSVRTAIVGTEVKFYVESVNEDGTIQRITQATYTSSLAPQYPMQAYASAAYMSEVSSVKMSGLTQPITIYSADQQTKDFGSLVAEGDLHAFIWQVSAIVGDGIKSEVFL